MAEDKTTTPTTPEIDYKAEFEKMQADYAKLKASFDKASTEIAENKRKERERMSDDEKKKAEADELAQYYKGLERRIAITDYESQLDDVTDAKIKREIAELFADGETVKAMAKHKEFRAKDREEFKKQVKDELKDELMKTNPQHAPQTGTSTYTTKEEIMAIKDTATRQKAIAENLHLFNQN
jgi:hypothetical protein